MIQVPKCRDLFNSSEDIHFSILLLWKEGWRDREAGHRGEERVGVWVGQSSVAR